MSPARINLAEFRRRLEAQGVASREDYAFICPMCGTVQSARSLIAARAGADMDAVETCVGFCCVGRFTGAGPASRKRTPERGKIGCDWSLGGLFQLHKLVVDRGDGHPQPFFELATPEQAQALAATFAAEAADA